MPIKLEGGAGHAVDKLNESIQYTHAHILQLKHNVHAYVHQDKRVHLVPALSCSTAFKYDATRNL